MKRAVSIVTLVDILFILALSLFASFGEPVSLVLRLLFVLIVCFVTYKISLSMREERERIAGVAEERIYLWQIKGRGLPTFLFSVMPTVALIFLVSFLTSLVLSSFGATAPTVTERSLFEMLLVNCLIPAIVEEAVFRYVPMKLLAPYSTRWCIILSALFFGLSHLSLYQLPYAFIAGLIFISLNLLTNSIVPSLLLHFINNAVSVLWIKYSGDPTFSLVFLIVLALGAIISLVLLLPRLVREWGRIRRLFTEGEPIVSWFAPLAFIAFTLVLSLSNLF